MITARVARQIKREIFLLEYASGDYDPTSNEAHEMANNALKRWARGYPHTDLKEIYSLTGNSKHSPLGKEVKRANKDNSIYDDSPVEYDNTEYNRLNGLVLSLTPLHSLMLDIHYKQRGEEPVVEYIERGATQFHNTTGYYKVLKLAKQEFILKGGI